MIETKQEEAELKSTSIKEFKEPKFFGKDEDGEYLGRIEQIGLGKDYDTLYISNRHLNLWIFSLFTGYRQLGKTTVEKPHEFYELQDVVVKKVGDKIVEVLFNNEKYGKNMREDEIKIQKKNDDRKN